MPTFSISQAKAGFSDVCRRVESGETVIVTRRGKPVLEMRPCERKGGLDLQAGRRYLDSIGVKDPYPIIPDDVYDPLPEDFLLRPLP